MHIASLGRLTQTPLDRLVLLVTKTLNKYKKKKGGVMAPLAPPLNLPFVAMPILCIDVTIHLLFIMIISFAAALVRVSDSGLSSGKRVLF